MIIIDPTRIYMINGQVYTLKTAQASFVVVNDQALVSAVAGYKVRIMGWKIQSFTNIVGSFQLKNSTGAFITAIMSAPALSTGFCNELPVVESGYEETATGAGLSVDTTVAAMSYNIFYLQYKVT